jgi:hypothetical protein
MALLSRRAFDLRTYRAMRGGSNVRNLYRCGDWTGVEHGAAFPQHPEMMLKGMIDV